ncbi:MAG TPA: hypothetical protein VFW25_08190 [Silvibacterium sp.]|nr:hypothetical protein [Silvibacterium sp.]
MFKRTFQLLLFTCLITATVWAATESFVGDWKLNPSKSQFIDRMMVASIGGNNYEFNFGGGSERIVVNGTDQSGISGTTLSVAVEGPNNWKVVRKKDGHVLISATWKLSQDGNTLIDNFTQFGPNGSPSTVHFQYKRTAAGQGFAGSWESLTPTDSEAVRQIPRVVLQIRPYEGSGLSLIRSAGTQNLKFDGKDYPDTSGGVAEGSTKSARRVDEHTLEIVDKTNGKIVRTERVELSPDRKTLTMTMHPVAQREPNIYLFERE